MVSSTPRWKLQGDYFENCNCDVVCPCEVALGGQFTAQPTEGYCDVGLAFHIDRGTYGDVSLDGLNVVGVVHTPGPMGEGNWKMALYLDDRANGRQREALQAIFAGAAGGPMAGFAPLVGEVLGVKYAPISYSKDGKKRSVRIPEILEMAIHALPSMKPDGSEIWLDIGHPFSGQLALAAESKAAPGATMG